MEELGNKKSLKGSMKVLEKMKGRMENYLKIIMGIW
jgi:hypothetical protein